MNKLGAIDTSTANIGGNIMVRQIQKHHTLMSVTKTIDTSPPWSYRQHPSPKAQSIQTVNMMTSPVSNNTSPLLLAARQKSFTSDNEKLDLNKENIIDIEQELEAHDQIIYKQFMEMLSKRKCIAHAQLLATSALEKIEQERANNRELNQQDEINS